MEDCNCRFCFESPCRCDELTYTPSLQEIDATEAEQPDEAYFVHIPLPADDDSPNLLADLFEEPFSKPVDNTRYKN